MNGLYTVDRISMIEVASFEKIRLTASENRKNQLRLIAV